MQVKRYEAAGVQEALLKIKNDLGPEAIVLSTKRLPGEKGLMEIIAARDDTPLPAGRATVVPEIEKQKDLSFEDRKTLDHLRKELEEIKFLVRDARRLNLTEEFAELKDSLHNFFDVLGLRGQGKEGHTLGRLYQHLVGRGISKARACKLLDEIKRRSPEMAIYDYESGLKEAESIIKGIFGRNSARKENRVKVFLGPTGVGKTTTLAKIAARYALEDKKKVGLITMDTYRIAALEQLKVYARIMGLPLEVATERDSFGKALKNLADKEVILVDTPGKSRTDTGHLPAVLDTLKGCGDVEKNLLLSLTSGHENMLEVIRRFKEVACDQIIFTKVDEASRLGYLYDVIELAGKPVTYVTTGQNVPQDIEEAEPARLAELVMWN